MKADIITFAVLLVVVTIITLVVLVNYHPQPVIDVLNSCADSAQYVGNCIVK